MVDGMRNYERTHRSMHAVSVNKRKHMRNAHACHVVWPSQVDDDANFRIGYIQGFVDLSSHFSSIPSPSAYFSFLPKQSSSHKFCWIGENIQKHPIVGCDSLLHFLREERRRDPKTEDKREAAKRSLLQWRRGEEEEGGASMFWTMPSLLLPI